MVAHLATTDEKISGAKALGLVCGFVGVIVMMGAGAGGSPTALLMCLAAALSYALAGVWGRRFGRLGLPPLATALGQVTASSVLLLPIWLVVDHPWRLPLPGLPVWGALVGIAALSTALAYALYFRLLAEAGAVNLLLVTFLIPVSATLLGMAFLAERPTLPQIAAFALIGLGLAVIDGRLRRRARPHTPALPR